MSRSSQTLLPKNPKIQPNLDKLYKSLKCRKSVEYRLRYFGIPYRATYVKAHVYSACSTYGEISLNFAMGFRLDFMAL